MRSGNVDSPNGADTFFGCEGLIRRALMPNLDPYKNNAWRKNLGTFLWWTKVLGTRLIISQENLAIEVMVRVWSSVTIKFYPGAGKSARGLGATQC